MGKKTKGNTSQKVHRYIFYHFDQKIKNKNRRGNLKLSRTTLVFKTASIEKLFFFKNEQQKIPYEFITREKE